MQKHPQSGLVLACLVVSATLLPTAAARAKIIDPNGRSDALLDSLSDVLDTRGIDVRRRWSKQVGPGVRPIIGRLDSYPVSPAQIEDSQFSREFVAGSFANTAVLAVESPNAQSPVPSTLDEFEARWKAAPVSKRVFISFARADAAHARSVADALTAKGYVAYVYINDAAGTPVAAIVQTAEWLRQAGHHLVIDTASARSSAGVQLERAMVQAKVAGRTAPMRALINRVQAIPCCRLCYYRDGALVRCDPPKCGAAECAGAR